MSIRVSLRIEPTRHGPLHIYQCESCGGSGSGYDCDPLDVEADEESGPRCGLCRGRGERGDWDCECPTCMAHVAGEAVAHG